NTTPVEIRPWFRIGRNGTRLYLVQVYGLAHAIRVGSNVAHSQSRVRNQLSFDGKVPLRGLRIAVVNRRLLVEVTRPGYRKGTDWGCDVRELVGWLAVLEGICRCAHDTDADVGRVERELPPICHRENAEATTNHTLLVPKRTICKPEARLEILLVERAHTRPEALRTGGFDRTTRSRGVGHAVGFVGPVASMDGFQKSLHRNVVVGNDYTAVSCVERSQIVERAHKRRKRLPAHSKT